jgi:hypothetical protein
VGGAGSVGVSVVGGESVVVGAATVVVVSSGPPTTGTFGTVGGSRKAAKLMQRSFDGRARGAEDADDETPVVVVASPVDR